MIRQITEKSIGQRVRFHLFYSTTRWMFFEVVGLSPEVKSLAGFLDEISSYPNGISLVEIVEENKTFQIMYDERQITEEKIIEFAKDLGL